MPSDILSPTAQSTALNIFSNVLAQGISSYKRDAPLSLNCTPILNFALFTILSTPPNILWQRFLEDQFPTTIRAPHPNTEKPHAKEQPQNVTSIRNIAIKFLLDMTIGAAVNTVLFLGFMSYVNAPVNAGLDQGMWDVVANDVRRKFWPLIVDGLKLWPAVSLMSFCVVPVDKRVLVGSLVGVGWNVYLSLLVGA
ncbi:hypothetical protein M011DRAFT_399478 [Sporormia fimetaria CBS 119925]|uniref:Integral membrane protein-like protein n=1 Tax=Sporormia fimetaria CBS 119925 TaxID=1340428 RepID=A0A6A6VGM9_9PLEO|nr:hypothetical protein M011DRAFT_399478 [Sporormia fimetaria CBS 119925]